MAFWALGIVVAPMLGPVIGGWVTDNYSWRWIFYINIPIGVVALIMTKMFVFDPSYIGRKSGRAFTFPISYAQNGLSLRLITRPQKTWWKNLGIGAPVTLWLRGEERTGQAEVVLEDHALPFGEVGQSLVHDVVAAFPLQLLFGAFGLRIG